MAVISHDDFSLIDRGDGEEHHLYACSCGFHYLYESPVLLETKEQAYLAAVDFAEMMAREVKVMYNDLEENYKALRRREFNMNTIIYTSEKYFTDIVELLEKKEYDKALSEAEEGFEFVLKEQKRDKADVQLEK